MRSVAVAAVLALALSTASCGDDSGGSSSNGDGDLTIPHSVVESLTNYAFTSDLQLTSAGEDLHVRFDGVYEAPGDYQGELESNGTLDFGQPDHAELIAVGQGIWLRQDGGTWQAAGPSLFPLQVFLALATPQFFVGGLTFQSLELASDGSETINGIDAYHIRLDKSELIGTLDQGSLTQEGDKDPTLVREDALAFLPEDTVVDAWLAQDDLHPVRITISFSSEEGDEHAKDFSLLENPFSIQLKMDITDPDVDVQIEPPFPIEATPTPQAVNQTPEVP